MQRFVDEYRLIQTNPNHFPLSEPLPDPDRFLFDTETSMALPPGPNPVYMLWFLATHQQMWSNPSNDPKWFVPGYPTGTTLASLYEAARQLYGWPADINDQNPANPGIIADAQHPAIHQRNRSFLVWWYGVCQRASDAVMANCAYSVIHQTWGAHEPDGTFKVKCGNYGDQRADGVNSLTSWFEDRDSNASSARHPERVFPRTWIERNFGSPMYRDPEGQGYQLRWLGVSQWASGDLDCPYHYWLSIPQWLGHDGVDPHQQANLYRPPGTGNVHPPETVTESTVRLNLEDMEASNDSYGGGHEDRLVNWDEMVGTQTYDPVLCLANPADPNCYTVSQQDLREELMAEREKNGKEKVLWTNFNPSQHPPTSPAIPWQETTTVMNQVWASRVAGYKRVVGAAPAPTVPPGPDNQIDGDPSRLEFTHRVNGADRTVDSMSSDASSDVPMTELLVEFSGLGCYHTHYPPPHDPLDNDYIIRIKCSTDKPGTAGLVQVMDFAHNNNWVTVPAEEGAWYGCYAPSTTSCPPADYSNRRTFILHDDPSNNREFVSWNGHIVLRLVHMNPQAFRSSWDLVQVAPFPAGSLLTGGALPAFQADFNFDDLVSSADLAEFMAAWFAGKPSADVNLDGQVDAADLLAFLNSFAHES